EGQPPGHGGGGAAPRRRAPQPGRRGAAARCHPAGRRAGSGRSPVTLLLMLRHGPTAWNEAGRIQGRSDPPLSAAGRAAVAAWTLPPEAAGARWLSSPLGRARETAAILHRGSVAVEPRLIETDWGEWEGRTLPALRAALGEAMAANEARGLDFRPPGGESPRDVQD